MKKDQKVRKVMMRLTKDEYLRLKSFCAERDIFLQDALQTAVIEMLEKGLVVREEA